MLVVHLTEEGSRLVAAVVAAALEEHLGNAGFGDGAARQDGADGAAEEGP